MPTLLPPTKKEKIGRCAAYAVTSGVGVYTIITASTAESSLQYRLGAVAIVWSLFILCSLPAAVATLFGRYRIEYCLLPLFGSALTVAVISTWWNVLTLHQMDLVPRVCISTALVFLFAVRHLGLREVMKVELPWTPTKPLK